MQRLRLTSLRRLCLSTVTQVSRNTLVSALSYPTRSFDSSSIRWDQSTSQPHHQIVEGTKGKRRSSPVGGAKTRQPPRLPGQLSSSAPTKARTPSSTLYIGNLQNSTTDDDLRGFFSLYGPLRRVRVGKDREGRPEGYAHVEFESKGDAVKVSEDHNESPIRIGGREVWIGFASPSPREGSPTSVLRAIKGHPKPSPTIFVVNVPYEATRDDIREALKHIGDVAAVRIALGRDGGPRGFVHVDFTSTTEAENALDHYRHHAVFILDRKVRLERSSLPGPVACPPSPTLYFTKWEGDLSSLRSHLRAFHSQIVRMHILEAPVPGHLPGSAGFIEFRDVETAAEALARFNAPGLALAYARPKVSPESGSRSITHEGEKSAGSGLGTGRQHGRSASDE